MRFLPADTKALDAASEAPSSERPYGGQTSATAEMPEAVPEGVLSEWKSVQAQIARSVVETDDVPWQLDERGLPLPECSPLYCCGADVSFAVDEPTKAVATVTAIRLSADGERKVVYSRSRAVTVDVPYAPTFLAFRESRFVRDMVQDMPDALRNQLSVILLDGNGRLHPRKAGLACHVAYDLGGVPTIGVAKTLMCVDGLVEKSVRAETVALGPGGELSVVGVSGCEWARAILTGNASSKPLFVSVGNRVSLATATKLVRALCQYRVPEPIRLADHHSREALRGNFISVPFEESCDTG